MPNKIRGRIIFISSLSLSALFCSPISIAATPTFSSPVDCVLGKECFIQQYVDIDSSPSLLDYECGKATYNGHKGTDIRLPAQSDINKGVNVLAAASGRVRGMRNNVKDTPFILGKSNVKGIECGNGVVLTHNDGWQTQYCHLRKGSVTVKTGEKVKQGQKIGEIGISGKAEFPHVHFQVKYKGKIVDPFIGLTKKSICGKGLKPLWNKEARAKLTYNPTQIIQAAFADKGVELKTLRKGYTEPKHLSTESKALVGVMWAINLKKGDRLVIQGFGPAKKIISHAIKIKKAKAEFMLYSGRKRPKQGWAKGTYRLMAYIVRNNKIHRKTAHNIEIK